MGKRQSLRRPRARRLGAPALVLLLSMLLAAAPASSQLGRGRMQGTVTDTQGNPLAGVTVTAHNPEVSPSTLTSTTDSAGKWAVLGLNSATWTFTFELEGYIAHEINASVRGLSRNPPMDVVLERAEAPEGMMSATGVTRPELLDEGNRLFEEGDHVGALARWQEFLDANPGLYQVYVNVGNAYRAMGQIEEARAAYEKVLEQDPGESRALYNLGELLVEEGRADKALPYFERVVETSPGDPAVYYNVAEIYFDQRVVDRAVEYYKRALEIDPTYLPAQKQLGFAYVNLGDMEQAIAAFEKFLEMAPEDHPDVPLIRDVLAALKSR